MALSVDCSVTGGPSLVTVAVTGGPSLVTVAALLLPCSMLAEMFRSS